jgi:hypothetical protein
MELVAIGLSWPAAGLSRFTDWNTICSSCENNLAELERLTLRCVRICDIYGLNLMMGKKVFSNLIHESDTCTTFCFFLCSLA